MTDRRAEESREWSREVNRGRRRWLCPGAQDEVRGRKGGTEQGAPVPAARGTGEPHGPGARPGVGRLGQGWHAEWPPAEGVLPRSDDRQQTSQDRRGPEQRALGQRGWGAPASVS